MTAKQWFVLSIPLVFVGPWVIGYVLMNLLEGWGWVGFIVMVLAVVIAIPVFVLGVGISASFAFMRRGIKPPAADDSGVLSSDVHHDRGP